MYKVKRQVFESQVGLFTSFVQFEVKFNFNDIFALSSFPGGPMDNIKYH